jgi:hypothetical protein
MFPQNKNSYYYIENQYYIHFIIHYIKPGVTNALQTQQKMKIFSDMKIKIPQTSK